MKPDFVIVDLLNCIHCAIESGDWKVDGACDPDAIINRAEKYLFSDGWCKDEETGRYLKKLNTRKFA